jgi:hypothetical protein
MEEELAPAIMRISSDHAQMISSWGRMAFEFDDVTEDLRLMIERHYAVNVREFNLLGPEMRYHLRCGLDENFKDILTRSNSLLGRGQTLLSPEDRELMRLRKNINARVARSFQRMKREFYPQLATRFVPPTVESQIDIPEIDLSNSPVAEIDVSNSPVAETPRSPLTACPIREEVEDDDSEVFEDIGHLGRLNLSDCQLIHDLSDTSFILSLVDELLLNLSGTAGIINDASDLIGTHISSMDFAITQVFYPFNERNHFDFLISMPTKKYQLSLFTNAMEMKIPFLLYLPMSTLDNYHLSTDECRLNLIIVGSCAWFIAFFPVEAMGMGGSFKIVQKTTISDN